MALINLTSKHASPFSSSSVITWIKQHHVLKQAPCSCLTPWKLPSWSKIPSRSMTNSTQTQLHRKSTYQLTGSIKGVVDDQVDRIQLQQYSPLRQSHEEGVRWLQIWLYVTIDHHEGRSCFSKCYVESLSVLRLFNIFYSSTVHFVAVTVVFPWLT